jgi:hypothetical protein
MDVSDLNEKKRVSDQMRDPLNPVYLYHKPNGGIYRYGEF